MIVKKIREAADAGGFPCLGLWAFAQLLHPAIPRQVARQRCPPPLHRARSPNVHTFCKSAKNELSTDQVLANSLVTEQSKYCYKLLGCTCSTSIVFTRPNKPSAGKRASFFVCCFVF